LLSVNHRLNYTRTLFINNKYLSASVIINPIERHPPMERDAASTISSLGFKITLFRNEQCDLLK
jgi:hypothetical protein